MESVSQMVVGDESHPLRVRAYADVLAAQDALQQGTIAGYLVIPPQYLSGAEPALFYGRDAPNALLESALTSFMRRILLPEAPAWALARLDDPSTIVYVGAERGLELTEGPNVVIRFAFPAVLAIVIGLLIFTGANQMGPVVVREKENRAMEMMITSLSPWQLVIGKVLGTSLLTLTQIGAWITGGVVAVLLAGVRRTDLTSLSIPWSVLVWALLLGIPAYFLFAVLASGLGIMAGDSRQAQQLSGVLGMFVLAPLWFAGALVSAPNSAVAVALTIFPLTAPVFALFRMTVTAVPSWQLTTALILIGISLVAGVWVVARIFRTAMLMYGQTLGPRQLWLVVRQA